MKTIKGILFIIISLAISALLWYFATPEEPLNQLEQLGYAIGGVALTSFSLVFLLSARNKRIEKWFNGLENVYLNHKILAVFAVALTFLHGQVLELGEEGERGERSEYSESYERDEDNQYYEDGGYSIRGDREEEGIAEAAKELGEIARNGFLFLVIVALFAKFLKYEHWRFIHRLMIIPFTIGLFHMYFTDKFNLFQFTPIGIFMAIVTIVGIGSGLYMLAIYQPVQFKHKGKITAIHKMGSAVQLEMTLDKKLQFQDGQYIFLKVFQQGLEEAPHPFTISGGEGNKITVTIKALGDFTKKLNEKIQLNTPVAIEGPYGHMDFAKAKSNQLWIAGGVGITPFMSYLKSKPLEQKVELFYSFRGQEDGIYRAFLEEYAASNDNLTVHFCDTTVDSRLDFTNYALQKYTSIFMCGPAKMIKTFNKQLKAKQANADITFEAFKFR